MSDFVNAEDFIGKTFTCIQDSVDEIIFKSEEFTYKMYHHATGGGSVELEDVIGDFEDIIGNPILDAYESTNDTRKPDCNASTATWTFYHFATIKGSVCLRWYGGTHGYYAEEVSIFKEKLIKDFIENK
jgi:hypothetical protein